MKAAKRIVEVHATEEIVEETVAEAHLEDNAQAAVGLPAAFDVEAVVVDKSDVLSLHGLMNIVAETEDEYSPAGLVEKQRVVE